MQFSAPHMCERKNYWRVWNVPWATWSTKCPVTSMSSQVLLSSYFKPLSLTKPAKYHQQTFLQAFMHSVVHCLWCLVHMMSTNGTPYNVKGFSLLSHACACCHHDCCNQTPCTMWAVPLYASATHSIFFGKLLDTPIQQLSSEFRKWMQHYYQSLLQWWIFGEVELLEYCW